MKLIEFPEVNLRIAEHQPEYQTMPVHRFKKSNEGEVVCCWQLTWRERLRVLFTGVIWHSIWDVLESNAAAIAVG